MSFAGRHAAKLLRAAPEAGALRYRWKKFAAMGYPPPPIPVTEVVVDQEEVAAQKFMEMRYNRKRSVKQDALDKFIPMNMKLIPEGAAPFLKEQIKAGFATTGCPLCLRNLQDFTYKDILILRQYVDAHCNILDRETTRLCPSTYGKMKEAVEEAKFHGLLPKVKTEDEEEVAVQKSFSRQRSANIMWEQLRAAGGMREDKLAELANVDQQVFK